MTTDGTLALAALQWATHAMETRAVVTRAAVGTRAVRSPTRSFARATGRPAAAAVTVTFIDEWTSELIGTSAEVDETALAVAAACGAIELTDEFCLEGTVRFVFDAAERRGRRPFRVQNSRRGK